MWKFIIVIPLENDFKNYVKRNYTKNKEEINLSKIINIQLTQETERGNRVREWEKANQQTEILYLLFKVSVIILN